MISKHTEEILNIIKTNPGCTATDIQDELRPRSWWFRTLGRESLFAHLLDGVHYSLKRVYMHVWRLQDLGLIRLENSTGIDRYRIWE